MARGYLIFGDIEGKLEGAARRVYEVRAQGPITSCRQVDPERWPRWPHDEMAGAAQRRLPEAGRTATARPLRSDLPRSAEGSVARWPLQKGRGLPFP